jgi:hypothetical protein
LYFFLPAQDRSQNRGSEPEGMIFATFGTKKLVFINSERANIVWVYDVSNPAAPKLEQILPCSTLSPEGGVAIPSRGIYVSANEVDSRADKYRSTISIFQDTGLPSIYPSLESNGINTPNAGPWIPFSSLSGLASAPGFGSTPPSNNVTIMYAIEDAFFRSNRILTIAVTDAGPPYRITSELRIRDSNSVLANTLAGFPNVVVANRINADRTVNIDPEGIATSRNSSFVWIVSEGSTATLAPGPIPNLLLRVSLADGNILQAVTLPPAVNARETSNGFVGVAEDGNYTAIAFQRPWVNETLCRIGLYNVVTNAWKFVFYPLDSPTSQFGGTVGLADIAPLGSGRFLIVERDSQSGPDATIKRLYEISLGANLDAVVDGTNIAKTLKVDLMPRLALTWGSIPEKVEGLTVDARGNIWVINDNDGVVRNSGEQQLNNVGPYVAPTPVAPPVLPPVVVPTAPMAPVQAPAAPAARPVAPVTPPTAGKKKCGLFGLRVFCPKTRCGWIGRILKLCKQ